MCIHDHNASTRNWYLPTPGQTQCILYFSIMLLNISVGHALTSWDEDLVGNRKLSMSAQGKKEMKQSNTKQLIE